MDFRIWLNILLLGMLGWFTYTDIKSRVICWPAAAAAGIAGLALHLLHPDLRVTESLWGLLPGVILLLLSIACGEALGRGDCYVLMACGSILGFARTFLLLSTALIFAASWAVLLLLRKKAGRKSEMPFMPFMLAAQICAMFLPAG